MTGPPSVLPPLSPRRREVLDLMAAGRNNYEIAAALGIAYDTAKQHVADVLRRYSAKTRAHAVAQAYRCGDLP